MKTLKRLLKLKRNLLILLFPISLIIVAVAKKNVFFAETIHARGFFKVYSQIYSLITGVFPFSAAEIVIVFSPFIVIGVITWRVIRYVKSKKDLAFVIWRDVLTLAGIASLAYFLLSAGCTVNYYRKPLDTLLGIEVRDSSVEELEGLCRELAARASELRAQLTPTNEDANGCFRYNRSYRELAGACRDAFDRLAEQNDIFKGTYARPKTVIHSTFMSKMEFTGVYVPFSMESNVNIDAPAFGIASTMCHEQAHLRGFIREDEANYIGYLACVASGDPELEYSGVSDALIYVGNALAAKNWDAYCEIWFTYDPGIRRDYDASGAYWKQFEDTPISNAANEANDKYLKNNDQEDGVQSYGRVVDLLLAQYRKEHGIQ